ncbi:hypothetical protein TFLX_06544 [Thermoflexales bacterium]|nr:hypothetical protein TFLX_06544 [Thermoflexales bacterium]
MSKIEIEELAKRCHAAQTAREVNSEHCRELFQRALAEQDQQAWSVIYQEFGTMVTGWVYTYSRFRETGEDTAYFVNEAFARLNRYGVKHAQAGTFEKLSSYLQFLKECVWSAIENHLRQQKKDALWAAFSLEEEIAPQQLPAPDPVSDRAELLAVVRQALHATMQDDEREQIVVEEAWGYGLPPRTIHTKHPQLFSSPAEVNQVKHNLLKRLKRQPLLKELQVLTG